MYTSDIKNRRHRSLLEHRRIGVGKSPMLMLQKMEFARGGVCGGRKTMAVNSDVKTKFFFKDRPLTAVNLTTNQFPCPGYR